jgi:hypothetical protein
MSGRAPAALLLGTAIVFCPVACRGASGFHLPGARGAALGGISVVGGSWSPLRVAAFPARGYEFRASWARLYGIDGLEAGAVTLRGCCNTAGAVVSFQMLDTPASFSEAHLVCSASLAPAAEIVLGAGLDLASLRDGEGSFAREVSTSLGLSLEVAGEWEAGCAVFVPTSGAAARGVASDTGGCFRWGVGIPFARPLSLLVEEERRGRKLLRRAGAELLLPGGVAVRAGVVDSPFTVCLGVGLSRAGTVFDLSVAQHGTLGATPCATISYGSAVGEGEPGGRRVLGPRDP